MDWRVDEAALGLDLAEIEIIPPTEIPWKMGLHWGNPLEKPIELALDPEAGTDLPDAFLVGIPLFSTRLIGLLRSLGVDNLQEFDAVITDPRDDRKIVSYKAVNIVGLVECADLTASEYFEGDGPPLMQFDHLVIDETRARGLLFFRLGEDAATILVHERVADPLLQENLIGVRLQAVDSAP
ncbi:MAG: imm11 family protein [Planctomycetota bacterium]